jgi:non-heme chloroperoxidase
MSFRGIATLALILALPWTDVRAQVVPLASPRTAPTTVLGGVTRPRADTTLVLLHGLSDSWYSWSPIIPLLPSNWRVVALDLRGHGLSSGHGVSTNTRASFGVDTLAADVLAAMDAHQLGEVVLVGHSLGSAVAQTVTARAPHRIRRQILVNAFPTGDLEGLQALAREIDSLPDPLPLPWIRGFQEGTVARPTSPAFLDSMIVGSHRLPKTVWQGLAHGLAQYRPPAVIPRVATHLVWGDRDQWVTRDHQRALQALWAGSTLSIVPGSGHSPHWDQPKVTAQRIVDLVRQSENRS